MCIAVQHILEPQANPVRGIPDESPELQQLSQAAGDSAPRLKRIEGANTVVLMGCEKEQQEGFLVWCMRVLGSDSRSGSDSPGVSSSLVWS